MSEDTPDSAEIPPPFPSHHGGPSQQPRGGNLPVGIVVGTVALYVFYVGAVMAWGPNAGLSAFIPVAVYLVVALVFTLWRHTSLFGAGLLIGLGIFTLLGGGICIGAISRIGA